MADSITEPRLDDGTAQGAAGVALSRALERTVVSASRGARAVAHLAGNRIVHVVAGGTLLVAIAAMAPRVVGATVGVAISFAIIVGVSVAVAVLLRWMYELVEPLVAWIGRGWTRFERRVERLAWGVERAVRIGWVRARAQLVTIPQPEGTSVGPEAARSDSARFGAEPFQNEHLPPGGREVHAILSVRCDASTGGTAGVATVFVLDRSGSMGMPWSKLSEACRATEQAVDALPEGARFAIVAGNHQAVSVYPPAGGLAVAGPETRADARRALQLVWPEGGTAMGAWLLAARAVVDADRPTLAHVILLTDGRDESEAPEALDAAVAACRGAFRCDCRGIGTDWKVSELRRIASGLHGSVDLVTDPSTLAETFRAMTVEARQRGISDVSLRVQTPPGAQVRFLRQVSPEIVDLTGAGVAVDDTTGTYATGAWGSERRDYHLCLDVPVQELGAEMLAARITVTTCGREVASCLLRAIWTDDDTLVSRVDPTVAHYRSQAELTASVQAGIDAHRAGDFDRAADQLGRAVELAAGTGHADALQLLGTVVDIVEPSTGTVRLRRGVDAADQLALETRSTRTIRPRPEPSP